MNKRTRPPSYSAEFRECGVRLFRENRVNYSSDSAAYKAIAPKLGCSPDSLRVWCEQAERDDGQGAGLTGNPSESKTLKKVTPGSKADS